MCGRTGRIKDWAINDSGGFTQLSSITASSSCTGVPSDNRDEAAPAQFKPISLNLMQLNEARDFDLYLRDGGEYRLFAGRSVNFSEKLRGRLLDCGIRALYIRQDDLVSLEKYEDQNLDKILVNPELDHKLKAEVAYDAGLRAIRNVFDGTRSDAMAVVERNAGMVTHNILEDIAILGDLIWLDSHDHYTYRHSVNVGFYATALAAMVLKKRVAADELEKMSYSFFLHDIGITKVPSEILNKTKPLTRTERAIIHLHPLWGYDMLLECGHLTPEAAAIVLCHHERHNGSGYPFKREGDGIPFYAKICAIADAFESLTSERPYRKAETPFNAFRIMQNEMRDEFDPQLFKAFIMLLAGEA